MKNINNLKWTGLAINGLVAIIIGGVFIFLPQELIVTIVKLIGFVLGLAGLGLLIYSFLNNKKKGVYNAYHIFQGILNLAVGIVMVMEPQRMVDFIFFIIGLWTIAIGLFQIIYALRVRKVVNSGMFLLGNGIAFFGLGLIMILNPGAVINTMLAVIGAIIALLGIILVYFSFLVYKANKVTDYEDVTDDEGSQGINIEITS